MEHLAIHAGASKSRERFVERSRLRRRRGILLTLTPPPDALMLFGDVREREEMSECPRDRHRGIDWKSPQELDERFMIAIVAGPPALRKRTDLLDSFEQAHASPLTQRLSEHLSQKPHIVSERLLGIWLRCHNAPRPPAM
jgi:hypothetical protein